MSVWIRRAISLFVALLIAAAAGALWLVRSFDPQPYRAAAIEWMKQQHHRTLELGGPIRLGVFPRLQLELSGLSLSEVGRPYSAITVDEATLGVALMPLLRGTLAVDRVRARGLRLTLLRDAKGRSNFDDLGLRSDGPATVDPLFRFDLHRIGLADVELRVRDERAGIDGVLDLKALNTGRIADGRESTAELIARLGFKTPALKGELSGSTRFTPDFARGSLRLAGMNLGYKGDAPGASGIDAALRGALAWNGNDGAIDAQALTLRLSGNAGGIRFSGSTLTMARFVLDPKHKAYSINRLKLRLLGTRAGHALDLQLDWPELDVTGKALKGSALSGRLAIGGALPLQATFQGGAPVGGFDAVRVPAFVLRTAGQSGGRRLEALLRSELVLQPEQRSLLFEKSELDLQFDTPGLQPLQLGLTGTGAMTPGNARWSVGGQLNGNGFRSEGSAGFSGFTPQLRAQARFETLDLDSLLAPAAAAMATDTEPVVDMAALRLVNGSFSLRVGKLISRHYDVGDARVEGSIEAGMLRLPSIRANVWGGSVNGSVFADARASRVALRAVASGVDFHAMLHDLLKQDSLHGVGMLALDIDTAGRTPGELKSRLKGSAEMHLRDGAIGGIDLPAHLGQAGEAPARRQDTTIRASKDERTAFSELQASFRIREGVARSTDVQLRSSRLRLGGEGALDLTRGRVDYSARAHVGEGNKAQDGTGLAALRGLSVPVVLNGPFDAIVWKLQWSGATTTTTRPGPDGRAKDKPGARVAAPAPKPRRRRLGCIEPVTN